MNFVDDATLRGNAVFLCLILHLWSSQLNHYVKICQNYSCMCVAHIEPKF